MRCVLLFHSRRSDCGGPFGSDARTGCEMRLRCSFCAWNECAHSIALQLAHSESCWAVGAFVGAPTTRALSQARKSAGAVVASMSSTACAQQGERERRGHALTPAGAWSCSLRTTSGRPRMTVKDCGSKGLGAFAAEDRSQGRGSAMAGRRGPPKAAQAKAVRYASGGGDVGFHLGGDDEGRQRCLHRRRRLGPREPRDQPRAGRRWPR